jgi:serine protease SohB
MWTAVLLLTLLALFALYLEFRRRGRGTYKLERDATGFWRYHKETQFERKVAIKKTHGPKPEKGKGGDRVKEDTSAGKDKKSAVVIHFDGDIKASQHRVLADLIDEVELNVEQIEEVVVVVNSSGGMVTPYGHAFAQMERVARLEIPLTVCVDVAAASGGYLMSLPAQKIIAAPFAVVGSVGVMAFVPNVRGLLEKLSIDPRTFTVGKYKRTVSFTDEATEEEVARFESQLQAIQRMFLEAVTRYRPQVKLEQIETGDHWTAEESLREELGLVDQLGTSSEYLLRLNREKDVVKISQKRGFWDDGFGKLMSYVPRAY